MTHPYLLNLRNVAIIAHVDHGKTTLVDQLLKQSGAFRAHQQVVERVMDSNVLEKERGITILAKCTSVLFVPLDLPKDADKDHSSVRINIIDTPGHADFGGEVERILSMVDGVILLVDAAEGPMPQTKFVTSKALKLGLHPIVVINKADRSDARVDDVHFEIYELFSALEASETQLNFSTIYAAGREGWACRSLDEPNFKEHGLTCLFEAIVQAVESPREHLESNSELPFSMLVTLIESDPYLGRILTGKIKSGIAKPNMPAMALRRGRNDTKMIIEKSRLTKVLAFRGIDRIAVENAFSGDIVSVAGFSEATVADTLCDQLADIEPLKALPIDPPTLAMTFSINNSPLAGKEGTKVQSRVICERLLREAEGNVAIRVKETSDKDSFEVAGRGELQLGVLIETMRREGFELSISRPHVLFMTHAETNEKLEPYEEVVIDIDDEFTGVVVDSMSQRRAHMIDMRASGRNRVRIIFICPSRGLVGYHGRFLTETRGTGVMNRSFKEYGPYKKGDVGKRRQGVLISNSNGECVAYALNNLEERGTLFVKPGTRVYCGMVIGESTRSDDMDVNPLKAKQLTNMRASGKDDAVHLSPPKTMTLEQSIAYIEDDELVEVTPLSIRIRKRFLNSTERRRKKI